MPKALFKPFGENGNGSSSKRCLRSGSGLIVQGSVTEDINSWGCCHRFGFVESRAGPSRSLKELSKFNS